MGLSIGGVSWEATLIVGAPIRGGPWVRVAPIGGWHRETASTIWAPIGGGSWEAAIIMGAPIGGEPWVGTAPTEIGLGGGTAAVEATIGGWP